MRNNALCRVATDYDAKSRKIRHLAQPEADAANKLYVEQYFKMVKNQQRESDEKLTAFEKDVQALQTRINELQRAITTESKTTQEQLRTTTNNLETPTNGSETANVR